MTKPKNPHKGESWGDDSANGLHLNSEEEEEFNEEDWEENENDEKDDDGPASHESGDASELQSQRTESNGGNSNSDVEDEGEEEEEEQHSFDAEEEKEDYEEKEDEREDSENAGSTSGEEYEPHLDKADFNINQTASFSFGVASTSSALAQPPARISAPKTLGGADRAFSSVSRSNTSAAPSASSQTGFWPSVGTNDCSPSAPDFFSVRVQSASTASFAAAAPAFSTSSASPTPTESNTASASNAKVKQLVSDNRKQMSSISANAPVAQRKLKTELSLQFVDFKRSFGQNLRRTRSAEEEASEVRASLARYELVVPTDRFDDQIEKALYGP